MPQRCEPRWGIADCMDGFARSSFVRFAIRGVEYEPEKSSNPRSGTLNPNHGNQHGTTGTAGVPAMQIAARVEAGRQSLLAIARMEWHAATPREITSRSDSVGASLDRFRSAGRMPPARDNNG